MDPIPDSPSAAPVVHPRHRRFGRFSLRTLLIAVTLASFAMALFSHRYERQRRAVAAIEALGGKVSFFKTKDEPGPIEAWLRARLPRSYFDEVRAVSFWKTQVSDAGLMHLSTLTSLQILDLMGIQISDVGLAHLSGLTSLQMLRLARTPVSDAGLAHLSGLTSLQRLSLGDTQVSDAGLAHLSGLTSLQVLNLNGTRISDAGLAHLSGLTSLQSLFLEGTQVSDAGEDELHQSLPNCVINR